MKITKQNKEEIIPYNFDWAYGISIQKIREDLDVLEKLGATDINISYGENYGSVYLDIEAVKTRLETDEEIEKRLKYIKKLKQQEELKEIRELERLKAKYQTQ